MFEAFEYTAGYDEAISSYLREEYGDKHRSHLETHRRIELRYGMNPHQKPAEVYSKRQEMPIESELIRTVNPVYSPRHFIVKADVLMMGCIYVVRQRVYKCQIYACEWDRKC